MTTSTPQAKTGLGSAAETNRLLGYDAFLETGGANPSATSPAKNKYVTDLNAARESAISSGRDPYAGNLASLSTFSGGSQGGGVESGTGGGATTSNPSDPFSAYRGYLGKYSESLVEDPDVSKARTGLGEIRTEIDKIGLEGRREYESKLDESGGLRYGAQLSATQARRRSNSELADLAVRESGAARSLDALNSNSNAKRDFLKTQAELAKPFAIGDQHYDPTTGKLISSKQTKNDPFELSPGQSRYAYDPATGEYKKVASVAPLPKEPRALTEKEKEKPMRDDITAAASQLQQIVKTKGFKGISPDDYETMAAYLMSEYGYEATVELNKALDALGLFVDRSKR